MDTPQLLLQNRISALENYVSNLKHPTAQSVYTAPSFEVINNPPSTITCPPIEVTTPLRDVHIVGIDVNQPLSVQTTNPDIKELGSIKDYIRADESIENKLKIAVGELKACSNIIETNEKRIAALEEEVNGLMKNSENPHLLQTNHQLSLENESLKKEIIECIETLKQTEDSNKLLHQIDQERLNVMKKVDILADAYQKQIISITQLNEDKQKLEKDLEQKEIAMGEEKRHVELLKKESENKITNFKQKLSYYEEKLSDLEKSYNNNKIDFQKLCESLNKTELEKKQLQERYDLLSLKPPVEKIITEIKEVQSFDDIKMYNSLLGRYKSERNDWNKEIQLLNELCDKKDKEILELQQKIMQNIEDTDADEWKNKARMLEIDIGKLRLESLTAKKLQEEATVQLQKVEQLENDLNEKINQNTLLNENINQKEVKLNDSNTEILQLKEKLSQIDETLNSEKQNIQNLNIQLINKDNQLHNYEKKFNELTQQLNQQQQLYTQQQSTQQQLSQEINNLKCQLLQQQSIQQQPIQQQPIQQKIDKSSLISPDVTKIMETPPQKRPVEIPNLPFEKKMTESIEKPVLIKKSKPMGRKEREERLKAKFRQEKQSPAPPVTQPQVPPVTQPQGPPPKSIDEILKEINEANKKISTPQPTNEIQSMPKSIDDNKGVNVPINVKDTSTVSTEEVDKKINKNESNVVESEKENESNENGMNQEIIDNDKNENNIIVEDDSNLINNETNMQETTVENEIDDNTNVEDKKEESATENIQENGSEDMEEDNNVEKQDTEEDTNRGIQEDENVEKEDMDEDENINEEEENEGMQEDDNVEGDINEGMQEDENVEKQDMEEDENVNEDEGMEVDENVNEGEGMEVDDNIEEDVNNEENGDMEEDEENDMNGGMQEDENIEEDIEESMNEEDIEEVGNNEENRESSGMNEIKDEEVKDYSTPNNEEETKIEEETNLTTSAQENNEEVSTSTETKPTFGFGFISNEKPKPTLESRMKIAGGEEEKEKKPKKEQFFYKNKKQGKGPKEPKNFDNKKKTGNKKNKRITEKGKRPKKFGKGRK